MSLRNELPFANNYGHPNETMLAEGAGPVDGPFDTANSTRCELGGYAASLLFISLLHTLWGKKHKCDFRWVTDSKAAISKVAQTTTKSTRKMQKPSNADYLGIIQAEKSSLRRRIRPVWVKGHQNTSRKGAQSKDIKRNNHVDQVATWYRNHQSYRQSVEHTGHTPEAKVTISVNGIRVVGQEEETLRYHINGYHLRQYIQSQQKWNNKVWNTVDIELFGMLYRRLLPRDQVAHTRFIFDQWHTGEKRQKINTTCADTNVDKGPCCLETNENTIHVLRCKANPEQAKTLSFFRKQMSPPEYHPVFHLLKEGIISWFEGKPFSPDLTVHPRKFHDRIRRAIQDQEQIGWCNAIKVYLSVEWRFLADESPYENGTRDPGREWISTSQNNIEAPT
ncbi:hypothetical protein MHU86_16382 [Fragilaria crotonensis]|nr:hypothetical protein MHU86_16382 [Fragilaria crotonensis]